MVTQCKAGLSEVKNEFSLEWGGGGDVFGTKYRRNKIWVYSVTDSTGTGRYEYIVLSFFSRRIFDLGGWGTGILKNITYCKACTGQWWCRWRDCWQWHRRERISGCCWAWASGKARILGQVAHLTGKSWKFMQSSSPGTFYVHSFPEMQPDLCAVSTYQKTSNYEDTEGQTNGAAVNKKNVIFNYRSGSSTDWNFPKETSTPRIWMEAEYHHPY